MVGTKRSSSSKATFNIDITGTCGDEHWVLYISGEPLNFTPETTNRLYVN